MKYTTLVYLKFTAMKPCNLILILLLFLSLDTMAQSKVVLYDKDEMLNENIHETLKESLDEHRLELTYTMDFRYRCDYYQAEVFLQSGKSFLKITDCNHKILGIKELGNLFSSASENEKTVMLSYSIRDIISNPGSVPEPSVASGENQVQNTEPVKNDYLYHNEHYTRHFFSPTAWNLNEGELYYNTVYFFLHDVQYGISDNFSLGMGTTLIGIPFYLTPKISFRINEKSAFSLGDILIFGTWGSSFFGNLLYGIYTYGSRDHNVSLAGGWFFTNDNDLTFGSSSAVLNFSAMTRISDFVYLVTENYGLRVNSVQTAYYDDYDMASETWTYFEEPFSQKQTIIYGLTGFRFIRKSNHVNSWQFGLSYIVNFREEVPSKYNQNPWYTSASSGGARFMAIPTVSFTRKFGETY